MGINVLSLFDGIACGRLALERAGITVKSYYASEVDKKAILVANHNFPDIIQLGDVKSIDVSGLPEIDLLIGGSPCQGFSSSGKRLGFSDPRSALVFEFIKAVKTVKPKYWMLENVVMDAATMSVINSELGVSPVEINSALVSAQNRRRLYWANFDIDQPEDKGIHMRSILGTSDGYVRRARIVGRRLDERGKRRDNDRSIPIVQCLEVSGDDTVKIGCLTTVSKDNVVTSLAKGRYYDAYRNDYPYRELTVVEYCRAQTMPDDYVPDFIPESTARKMIGNAWTVDVVAHILRGINKDARI